MKKYQFKIFRTPLKVKSWEGHTWNFKERKKNKNLLTT